MHKSSIIKMDNFANKYLDKNKCLRILDLGSQDVNGTYKSIFNNDQWIYVGCDMVSGNNVDIVLKDIYDWKEIESNSFDVVITGQVFEHVEYFWITIIEIERILKEEGVCCIIAPSNGMEHLYPVDCWRFFPDGFRALAKYASLEILEVYTQWEDLGYKDGSDQWKDSVLICKKPVRTNEQRIILKTKNSLSKIIISDIHSGTLTSPKEINNQVVNEENAIEGEVIKTHRGFTVWFTGLSGAGKTTLSVLLAEEFCRRGHKVEILDGDQLRTGISRDLGFSREDRIKQMQRVGYLCELLNKNGIITVVSLISPFRDAREELRQEIDNFVEVYVKCPIEVLIKRDTKGLYQKALAGEIKNFTGVSDPYEEPIDPEVTVYSDQEAVQQSLEKISQKLDQLGFGGKDSIPE